MASLKKRGKKYYAQYYVGSKQRRICLQTESYQVAREKLRKLESSLAQGDENPLPSRTSIGNALTAYVKHIRTVKTPKSAQTDVYYLRSAFGPVCEALQVNSRKQSVRAMKRPPKAKSGQDRRCRTQRIEAAYFEQITTTDIAAFIASQVRSRGLAPKTANRYREILCRLFNWSMTQGGIRMPADKNPAAQVERYKQKASLIRFLSLAQIDEQLATLSETQQLQTMVAMYIYAGLRREEALWLTIGDIDLHAGGNGMIRIQAKTIGEEYWQPKTRINRAVPISRALRNYLDNYAPRPSIGGWYFPSP
ncbi:MAG: hypothetical protein GY794_03615, partial [bacterium]|nr:hypothetical protein [bacterium]